jgi:hypothetical protein
MQSKALVSFRKEQTRSPSCGMRYDQYLAQGWASGIGVIEGTYGHYMYTIIRSSTAIISDATGFSTCKRTIAVATRQVRTKRLSVEDDVEATAFGRAIIFSDSENGATQRHQWPLIP